MAFPRPSSVTPSYHAIPDSPRAFRGFLCGGWEILLSRGFLCFRHGGGRIFASTMGAERVFLCPPWGRTTFLACTPKKSPLFFCPKKAKKLYKKLARGRWKDEGGRMKDASDGLIQAVRIHVDPSSVWVDPGKLSGGLANPECSTGSGLCPATVWTTKRRSRPIAFVKATTRWKSRISTTQSKCTARRYSLCPTT
jgi:hypothetical protein